MKILLIGSGGREHALAWKIVQSPLCSQLYIAPGNAGTAQSGENLPVEAMDFQGIRTILLEKSIDLLIVGPDDPLGHGLVDFLRNESQLKNLLIIGPEASGARLEASKSFAKQFMTRHGIPTASFASFNKTQRKEAEQYIRRHSLPIVMKADGLAAGKGVVICDTAEEALAFINDSWEGQRFGESGSTVVIEQYLTGIELSVFILTDGKDYVLLPEAKDYKRINEGDKGENTGGMGAISPVPFATGEFMQKVVTEIIRPTLKGLQEEKIDYHGFLFFGLINVNGNPYVIEYNARMGDPETQVVMPRIKDDLVPVLVRTARGDLKDAALAFNDFYAAGVIGVSGGYPGAYKKGHEIKGMYSNPELKKDTLVFIAGAKKDKGRMITSGGRVLAVVGLDNTLNGAIEKAYFRLHKIEFEGMFFRRDIGHDLLNNSR